MRPPFSPAAAATLLVVAAVTGALLALGAVVPNEAASDPEALVEMEVKDVVALQHGENNVVILKEKGRDTILPIFIGTSEALAIHSRLNNDPPPRPMTHDLLEKVIRSLGGKLTRIHIDDVRENVYFGRIYLAQGGRTLELDARPSDSIALALGAHAKIFAARKVLDNAGLSRKDLDKLREMPPPAEEVPAFPGPRQQKL